MPRAIWERVKKQFAFGQVPMYDPHAILNYLFDEISLQIPPDQVRQYWKQAASAGCPWAQHELAESGGNFSDLRIPVKSFGGQTLPETLGFSSGRRNRPSFKDLKVCNRCWLEWCGPSTKLTTTSFREAAYAFVFARLVGIGLGTDSFGKLSATGIVTVLAFSVMWRNMGLQLTHVLRTSPGSQT